MKQSDILPLVVVAIISVAFSVVLPKYIFGSNDNLTVEKVPVISDNFQIPSSQYFNSQSIDVTPYITIGNSNNTQPFSSSQSN